MSRFEKSRRIRWPRCSPFSRSTQQLTFKRRPLRRDVPRVHIAEPNPVACANRWQSIFFPGPSVISGCRTDIGRHPSRRRDTPECGSPAVVLRPASTGSCQRRNALVQGGSAGRPTACWGIDRRADDRRMRPAEKRVLTSGDVMSVLTPRPSSLHCCQVKSRRELDADRQPVPVGLRHFDRPLSAGRRAETFQSRAAEAVDPTSVHSRRLRSRRQQK